MKYFVPAILWSLVILGLSTMSGISLPEQLWDILAWDKLAHAGVYGLQVMLIYYGFQQYRKAEKLGNQLLITGFLISVVYGIGMEVIQYSFFPNRYFEVLDIIANIIGSIIGLFLYRKYFFHNTKPKQHVSH